MAIDIPMPQLGHNALFDELAKSREHNRQKQYMQQAWQQHLNDLAIRQMQEQRAQQLLPGQLQGQQNALEMHPYNIEHKKAQTEKSQLEAHPERKYAALQQMFGQENNGMPDVNKMNPLQRAMIEMVTGRPLQTLTPQQKNIITATGDINSPQAKQMMADMLKSGYEVPGYINPAVSNEGAPEGIENAVPMAGYDVGARNQARKRMDEELAKIQKNKEILYDIDVAKDIMQQNPDLYRKAVGILFNPDKDQNLSQSLIKAGVSKDDLTAFIALDKVFSDIVNKDAEALGQRGSVYRTRLLQRAKASAKNPDEANEIIFNLLQHRINAENQRESGLLYAKRHNLDLPYVLQNKTMLDSIGYMNPQARNIAPKEINSATEMGMMKGIIDDKEIDVNPEDKEDFIKAGGKIL